VDLSLVVSLPEGVSVSSGDDGEAVLHGFGRRFVLRRLPSAVQDVLSRLVYPGDSIGRLAAHVEHSNARDAVARFYYYLQHLAAWGFLLVSAEADGRRLATLMPTASTFVLARDRVGDRPYVLSRFAHIRRFGDSAVIESPLSASRIVLHDSRAALLACALAAPATVAEISERAPGLSQEAAGRLVSLLLTAGMLAEVTERGTSSEDEHPGLMGWEFHDLLFHARSRSGRHDGVVGNAYALAGRREPPPPVKPVSPGETIELYRPALDWLEAHDPPLARVMEERRSIREYAAEPMTARQLGEILYRVARVRDVYPIDVDTPHGRFQMELSSRPYPTGGALFELEIYPVVQACRDLEPGLYHYDPLQHRLGRVCGQTAEVGQLLDYAGLAIGSSREELQVLLVLTARFERVFWKYSSLAYSLILKDVGVVFQNLYLAAAAMDLAPCAIGAGDSDVFARAIGSDYYAETSVGEFTLGSKR